MVKVVGKSSPGNWKVQPFARNKGDVGKKKICAIGASYKFVHKVLRDMLLVGGFNNVEICLHDIAQEPLRVVGDLLEKMARQKKTNITITRTLDRKEALTGADIVWLCITVGGQESDVRSWEVCAKYGIPVGVGDTLGPAALVRNIREIPVVLPIIDDMVKYCPKAVMLNFSNPMSCLTMAMARQSHIPVFGLCHSADSLFEYFGEVFQCKKTDIQMDVGGVNHQSFVTKLAVKGKDRTGEMLKASLASQAKFKDSLLTTTEEDVSLQQDVYRILGAWPSCGDSHLAEFYRYFMTPRHVHKLGHMQQSIEPGREPYGAKKPPQIILDWAYGPEPVGDLHLMTTEHAHELMWACLTGKPFTRVLNLLNTGQYIAGLPKNCCVEAMVTVAGKKVTGKSMTLPPAVFQLVYNWATIHELSYQASLNFDRQAAKQALFLDPHVHDMYDIDPMLDDFLAALKPWMPRQWYKA